jgi:hypothetical protein
MHLVFVGAAMVVIANPFLYLIVGAFTIDIRNIFGANIDRRSISFNTDDPFIQAMYLVSFIGVLVLLLGILGYITSKTKSK